MILSVRPAHRSPPGPPNKALPLPWERPRSLWGAPIKRRRQKEIARNNVTLIGYLGSDAETRTTRNDSTLTTLSLATQRTWKDRESGERQSQTTWHRLVVIWNRTTFQACFSF